MSMSTQKTYLNWRLETDAEQILWLYFDKQNASANTLDKPVLMEFADIITQLANDHQHKGLVIASAKKSGFIAGADISQFTKFKDAAEATSLLKQGHEILNQLAALRMPTVAMIEGFCLGGGLELSLACRYRVAEDGPKTRLGLPEVKLGIHPGWGGTVRLPRLIGAPQALNLILTGSTVNAKVAAKLGIVDVAVPKRHLVDAAKFYVLTAPAPHKPSMLQAMTDYRPVRVILDKFMRGKLREKVNPAQYPAPYTVLDNWVAMGVANNAAFDQEAETCGKLFLSETSKNLVRVYFLQERLKSLVKDVKFTPQHVHVIGGGTMGGDIAAWCALQGMRVTLQDREPKFIAPAIKRAQSLFKEKLKENYLVQKAMDRLTPDVEGTGIPTADIIIEAIFEDLTAKQNLFKDIETKAKPDAILATNTSSIPLDDINKVLNNKARLVGIHFFNPVAKMQLVEVVQGAVTDMDTVNKAISFVRKLDKLPLPVKSSPGFLVNRILMPYLLESMKMHEEGVPMAEIDAAMLDFGMPMGPFALSDAVGLDVCLSVAKYLTQHTGGSVPPVLISMVENKKLGRKTGEGFYQYKNGKQVKPKAPIDQTKKTAIVDRLLKSLLDEAFACLKEGVVADKDLLDAGMVYGTGFAPFRGGPIHYAETIGRVK